MPSPVNWLRNESAVDRRLVDGRHGVRPILSVHQLVEMVGIPPLMLTFWTLPGKPNWDGAVSSWRASASAWPLDSDSNAGEWHRTRSRPADAAAGLRPTGIGSTAHHLFPDAESRPVGGEPSSSSGLHRFNRTCGRVPKRPVVPVHPDPRRLAGPAWELPDFVGRPSPRKRGRSPVVARRDSRLLVPRLPQRLCQQTDASSCPPSRP